MERIPGESEIAVLIRYPDYTQEAIIKRVGDGLFEVVFRGVIERAPCSGSQASQHQPRRQPRSKRRVAISEIARDARLHSRAMHTRRALIDDVMRAYDVTYSNSRKLIHEARKLT